MFFIKTKLSYVIVVMKTSKPTSRKTSSNHKENSNCGDKELICDICAQNVPGPERENIFAFGKCDHFVCYVCSARLRVICDQSECPICRNKLETVSFYSIIFQAPLPRSSGFCRLRPSKFFNTVCIID